jgi:regulator of protease activity HflC (stomatin/prohibitin superfamily)
VNGFNDQFNIPRERFTRRIPRILIILIPVVVVISLVAVVSAQTIPAGYRGILLTWGKAEDIVLSEGLSFIIPFAQRVELMDVRINKYTITASAATSELLDTSTEVTVNYHLDPSQARDLYVNIGKEYEDRIIRPAVDEIVKATTAQFTAKELVQRFQVKGLVYDELSSRLLQYGITVDEVSMTDYQFPESYNEAINRLNVAEKDKETAQLTLERITIEAQQQIVQAEAEANATITRAEAEAEEIRLKNEQMTDIILQYLALEKWDGKLPYYFGGEVIPFLQIDNQTGS